MDADQRKRTHKFLSTTEEKQRAFREAKASYKEPKQSSYDDTRAAQNARLSPEMFQAPEIAARARAKAAGFASVEAYEKELAKQKAMENERNRTPENGEKWKRDLDLSAAETSPEVEAPKTSNKEELKDITNRLGAVLSKLENRQKENN